MYMYVHSLTGQCNVADVGFKRRLVKGGSLKAESANLHSGTGRGFVANDRVSWVWRRWSDSGP
jgi:hypothetical protein